VRTFAAVAGAATAALVERGMAVATPVAGRTSSGIAAAEVQVVYPALDPDDVRRVASELTASRDALAHRNVLEIAERLGRVGRRFLDTGDRLHQEALTLLPPTAAISAEMAAAVLEGMAHDWTEDRLRRLVETEFEVAGAVHPLDGFATVRDRRAMAVGPSLCLQIVAGSVPGVGVHAMVRSLLVKAPTLLKPGLGDVVLPILFARGIAEEDTALSDALAVVYWPGGSEDLEAAAVAAGEVVVAYGSNETVRALRGRTPVTTRFIAYHHRSSLALVGRAALAHGGVHETAAELARAVALFDQRGCVSPQIVYVEEGGAVTPDGFAERLARALATLEERLPSGPLAMEEAAALQQIRGTSELLGNVRHGGADAPWTVILEGETGPDSSCAGRVVRVRPIPDALELPTRLEPFADHLQTLGVAGLGERLDAIAEACGRVGISRVAALGSVAFPPPWWRHDGRGPLTELVRWVEVE
jgi:hypothetical protein